MNTEDKNNLVNEGEIKMNAYAVKPNVPFVMTKNNLKRTPASAENKEIVKYIDSHDFSFSVDMNTKELHTTIKEK